MKAKDPPFLKCSGNKNYLAHHTASFGEQREKQKMNLISGKGVSEIAA